MEKQDPLYLLEEETKHLPESSFYLWLADILISQAETVFKQDFWKVSRITVINEIQSNLNQAISLFKEDKYKYLESQKQGFLQRKIRINEKLKALEFKHNELLKKISLL